MIAPQSIAALPNLGPKSQAALAAAGITTVAQLRRLGSVAAYVAARQAGARVSLNLLWALEGALTGLPWQVVAREHRTSLLLALEQRAELKPLSSALADEAPPVYAPDGRPKPAPRGRGTP